MNIHRNMYTERFNVLPVDFLQSLFVAELIVPSSRVWLSSPWITDIDLINNSARQFAHLVPSWPSSWIRMSDVLRALVERGSELVVISNYDEHNVEFLSRIELLRQAHPRRVHTIKTASVHEKGILSDNFTLDGSMNFTYRGVNINQEYLAYHCDPETVHERRMVLEERWGNRL